VEHLCDSLGAIVATDRKSAELAMCGANAFLATRISFVIEIAMDCEAVAADMTEVAHVVGLDRRIGITVLQAGLGRGGSCFPKDLSALAATAAQHRCQPSILHAACDVNARQRELILERLRSEVTGRPDPTVAVLGLAFKPETDDVREAPALEIIASLVDAGVRVQAHDPGGWRTRVDTSPISPIALMSTPRQVAPTRCCLRPSGASTDCSTGGRSKQRCAACS
jgi:UDPglucose 6-dehydrogenase